MCVVFYLLVFVGACVGVSVCVWHPLSGVICDRFSNRSGTCQLKAGWAVSPRDQPVSISTALELAAHNTMLSFLTSILGIQYRSSHLQVKHFTKSSPRVLFSDFFTLQQPTTSWCLFGFLQG